MPPERRCPKCDARIWLATSACPLCGAQLPDAARDATRPGPGQLPSAEGETAVGVALALLEQGDAAGAALALKEATEGCPEPAPAALATLGLSLSALGMVEEAERTLYAAVRAAPADSEVRLAVALFARNQGRRTEARDQLVIAAALAPHDEAVQAELATLRAEFADAEDACRALLDVSRRESFRGRATSAEATLVRARDLNPEHPDVLRALTLAQEQLGRLTEALVTAHRWREAAPGDSQAREALVRLDARIGVREGAAQQARALLSCGVANPAAYGGALAILADALALEPGDAELHLLRGVALDGQGDPTAALEAYRAALRLDPAHAEARERLAGIVQAAEATERVLREGPAIEKAERMKRSRMLWRRRAAQAGPSEPDVL